jgi:5-(carboxyamino)imidazole ribonucleotide synthase
VGLPVLGMVGAGQLARMTEQAAISLGSSVRVLADTPGDSAAQVAADVEVGDYRSLADLRAFAARCDVVTFDHEHVPGPHLRALVADGGVAVRPGPDALRHAQDKAHMRRALVGNGVPVPAWAPVREPADVDRFAADSGWPVVLKAVVGGYDGRGVWFAADAGAASEVLAATAGTPLLVEQHVDLVRELAAVVARSPSGQAAAWPVVQTVQRAGICREVLAPAPGLDADRAVAAQELALRIARDLDVVGVLAVELFETAAGIYVNELAMRPHNSGHWTIEGARTSQFEQHVRAVLDLPLGDPTMTTPYAVMANVLGGRAEEGAGYRLAERLGHVFAHDPGVRVHLYGKQSRPGRKIGHVTALGADPAAVRHRAVSAAAYLGGAQ